MSPTTSLVGLPLLARRALTRAAFGVIGGALGLSLVIFLLISYVSGTLPGQKQCRVCGYRIRSKPSWTPKLSLYVEGVGMITEILHKACADKFEHMRDAGLGRRALGIPNTAWQVKYTAGDYNETTGKMEGTKYEFKDIDGRHDVHPSTGKRVSKDEAAELARDPPAWIKRHIERERENRAVNDIPNLGSGGTSKSSKKRQ